MSTRRHLLATLVAVMLLVIVTGIARGADYTTLPSDAISQATPWPGSITIPLTDPVTKANYWTTANVFYTSNRSGAVYWTAQPTPYLNISLYLNYGLWISRMYAITGQAADAELAAKCVEYAKRDMVEYPSNPACQPGADAPRILWWIHTNLTGSAYYTATHQQWVRDMAVDAFPSYASGGGWGKEYGSFNRSFGCALNAQCLLALVPAAPDASQWQTYIDTVWNYWWTYKDNDESTDHYNGLWFRYLLQWIEVRNCQATFWSDAGVKRMMDRYLYQVLPMGSFPHYGDTCGWNVSWGHWIHVFEACATAYNDPRYKWAAHRIYNYGINRIENLTSWAYTGEEAGWSMLNAWSVANDGIAEGPREKDVALTKRHRIVQRTTEQQQQTNQWFDLYSDLQPDKMVFTSGPDRDSLSMVLDAVGEAGHSHKKSPMSIALCDKQSLLLMALGYMERLPEEHDRPLVMDYDGYLYDSTEYHIKSNNDLVSQANVYELGGVGYGKIQVTQYLGYPANLDRDVVFIKGVGAIVKDMVTFTALSGVSDIWLRWGTVYRIANFGPDYGSNWINTYIGEWIPLRGLGVGAPVYTRWKNSKRDLLIYFLENANGSMEIVDHKQWDSTLPLPWRLQYSIRETTQANVPVSSTTLLLPHDSGAAQSLANGVTVHLDQTLKTVFSFTAPDGSLQSVIINRSGAAVSAGGLATDGQVAYVKRVGGTVTAVALYGGTYITVDGQDKTSMVSAAKEQTVPEPLTDVQVATDPNPPVEAENPITITATPVGGTMVQYQFQVGYDGGNWSTVQAYSSSSTCIWTPTAGHDYTIRVWAKEGDSTNQYDVQKDVPYQVTEPAVIDLGMVISTPLYLYQGGQWSNVLRNTLEPLGYSVGMGTSYAGGNTIGFDTNNTTATRYDLNAQGEFPTTPTVQNGSYSNKPSWWTFGTGGSTVVTPSYSGHAVFCWTTSHYALPLLDGDAAILPKSAIITIVPNVAERTMKKIAVIPTNGWNGSAVNVTVDWIKIGNFTAGAIFPVTVAHPGGTANSVVARGFNVPVIPGKNIEMKITLNSAVNVGVALAIEDQVDTPPTVSITSPSEGALYTTAPATVPITANAADADGSVSKVDFYQGTTLIGTDTNSGDGWSFNWTDVPAGSYTLTAVATDNLNLPTTSAPVHIRVNAPPTVSITSPANNAVIIGNSQTITADAADSDGTVSKVEFYQGANLLGTDTTSGDGWSWNWTSIVAGSYSLTAKAFDNDNVPTTSSVVNVTVWNTQDIGTVGQTGSAGYSSPTFTVTGAGAGITGKADAFRFVYQQISGDATLTARVVTFPGTSISNNRAGVMMRESLNANAREASSLFRHYNTTRQVYFTRRTSTGGNTQTTSATAAAPPYWVRVVRTGNTLQAYRAPDVGGAPGAWVQVGSNVTVTMANPIYLGLAVTSGTTSSTKTATFDNVTIMPSGGGSLKKRK
ncbi:MAG: Ig-like domain-containing protein [Armatimonadota bacterium]